MKKIITLVVLAVFFRSGISAQTTGIQPLPAVNQNTNAVPATPSAITPLEMVDLQPADNLSKIGVMPAQPVRLITGFWDLSGNSGIDPATNFIGTTDAQPLRFRVNNSFAGHIGVGDYNLFFGKGAGQNAVATGNTLLGASAGQNVTSSPANVFVGTQSGFTETNGAGNNTFIGFASGYSNTTGFYNTFTGGYAGFSNNSGTRNTFYGFTAGNSTTTGSENTFSGESSGYFNTTGSGNVFIGRKAGMGNTTASNNTFVGSSAGELSTTATELTAVGAQALKNNTGSYNAAVGYLSLTTNTTGIHNTAIGNRALSANLNGWYNSAIGSGSLLSNTSGINNTALGASALYGNFTGNGNTGVGYMANVSLGSLAYSTVIGAYATVNASYKISVGSSLVTVIGGQVGWSTFSDGRFKENIQDNVPGLEFITQLRPVTYTLNIEKYNRHLVQDKSKEDQERYLSVLASSEKESGASEKVHTGFIAQEVEQLMNKLGYHFDGLNRPQNNTDNYSINYSQFIMPLVKAVQEQQKQINELREIIRQQQQREQIITKADANRSN